MRNINGVRDLESLKQRFGNWSTFQPYWFAKRFVAHDAQKVPFVGDPNYLDTPKFANVNDPSTWRTPDIVLSALEQDTKGKLVGMGFVLNGDGVVCIDLDHAVDENGNITPEAQQILDRFPDTFAEYSQSERGIHIWLHTSRLLPENGRRTGNVEIYQDKRYIAITMNILPNRPQHMADYTDELHKLYEELFGSEPNPPSEPDDDETYQLSEQELNSLTITVGGVAHLDDTQLIAKFLQDPDNATVWNGDKLPHHPSQSEADCSLAVRLLFETDGDTQRTRNLFYQSPRALRDKVRNRPDLVDRAISEAYRYYLQRKQQLQYITQPASTSNWDITQPYPCAENVGTHDYSAKVCKAVLGAEIVYLHNRDGWMVYNHNTGLWDNSEAQLYQRVKSILEQHYYHLALSKTISEKELDRILARIHHGDTVKKVMERMEMMPELHGKPEMFNSNPLLIPLRNGVYDLDIEPDCVDPDSLRRKFRPYRPTDYITHAFDANYNPDADGEHWIHAIEQWCWDPVFNIPDDELIEYLWYAIGYTVTGSVNEQAMFVVYGPGGNGKSTLVGTIARMMAGYSTTVHHNLFTVDKNTSTDPARQLEPLCNKRMVMHPELPTEKKLDTAKIKLFVSNKNEELQVRRLYEEERKILPTWKIWCTANDIPEITDPAAWRRIRIIPFRKVFVQNIKTLLPVGERDPKLPQKLWEQRDYLATQACHYAAFWRKRRELPHCTAVAQTTDDVHRVSDPFEDWFQKCVDIDRDGVVPNNEAYEHYKKYVESLEQSPLTIKKWAQRMAQKRVPVVRTMYDGKQTRCRRGIKLIQPDN